MAPSTHRTEDLAETLPPQQLLLKGLEGAPLAKLWKQRSLLTSRGTPRAHMLLKTLLDEA